MNAKGALTPEFLFDYPLAHGGGDSKLFIFSPIGWERACLATEALGFSLIYKS